MTGITIIEDKQLIHLFKEIAEKAWESKYSMRDDNQYEDLPEVQTDTLFEADVLSLGARISEHFRIAKDEDGTVIILNTKKMENLKKLRKNPDQIPYIAYDPKTNTLKAKNWEDSHGIYAGAYTQRLAKAYRII